jgi:hypothetical protein
LNFCDTLPQRSSFLTNSRTTDSSDAAKSAD